LGNNQYKHFYEGTNISERNETELLIEVLFSLPAIPSSIIASHLNKKTKYQHL
jgi:hypothetical protein